MLKNDSTYFKLYSTEPDTPLVEADHVGSFNLSWSMNYAREILNNISYFRIIKAYSLRLKPKNGIYEEFVGVTLY